ncbi:MAG: DUF2149 domain-containing protein [Myxococcota bacterium]
MNTKRADDRFNDRFSASPDPLANMASLVDVILVFACGLLTALVAAGAASMPSPAFGQGVSVKAGRELTELPEGIDPSGGGPGYESLGTVYRDPKTGRLILIESD